MFGKRLFGSSCACGCAGYVQLKSISSLVEGVAGITPACTDLAHARTWMQNNLNTLAGCGFVPNPSAWAYLYDAVFDHPSDTTPNLSEGFPCNGGGFIPNNGTTWAPSSKSAIGTSPGAQSNVIISSVLLPYSTAYLIGQWCANGHSTAYNQKSCIMSGVPTAMGFRFDIPIPLVQICEDVGCDDSTPANAAFYNLVPNSGTAGDPGMYPFGGDWSNVLADIAANPTHYQSGFGTPSACLSPDPFYGSSPP